MSSDGASITLRGCDENAPALLMYRHIFELIDSISILINNSCVEPCNILLRSLFESFLNFNYLFEGDFKIKGMDFLVWHRHGEIESLKRFDPDDGAYNKYTELKARDIFAKDVPVTPVPDIKERIERLKRIFALPSYKDSSDEYERIRTESKKGKPPKNWYGMRSGPNNAWELANHLKYPGLYEVFYRSWSGLVHGTDILDDKLSIEEPGVVAFSQLRLPTEAPSITLMTMTFGLSAMNTLVDHYVPDRTKEKAEWYQKEIMEAYKGLSTIKIVVR